MTVEIDAGCVGVISQTMRTSAAEKGQKAIDRVERGDAEGALFYATWAANHARCLMEIDRDWEGL